MKTLNEFEQKLINLVQKGFPLCAEPFKAVAQTLGVSESKIIDSFKNLKSEKILSRVGPIFRPNSIGASSLVAMKVDPSKLDEIADIVSSFESVNHNYARTHEYNLWYVIAAASQEDLASEVKAIEEACSLPSLVLPLEKEYFIDLGFELGATSAK